jgi:choline/glycine/proline betaine transport protein
MCYTVYLGLDNEYQILESEAFAQRVEDLTAEGDLEVVTSGDATVTNIREGDDTASGD